MLINVKNLCIMVADIAIVLYLIEFLQHVVLKCIFVFIYTYFNKEYFLIY